MKTVESAEGAHLAPNSQPLLHRAGDPRVLRAGEGLKEPPIATDVEDEDESPIRTRRGLALSLSNDSSTAEWKPSSTPSMDVFLVREGEGVLWARAR